MTTSKNSNFIGETVTNGIPFLRFSNQSNTKEIMKTMTIKQAKEYLEMFFGFFTELRTICNDETNIVTKNDLSKYSDSDIITMAEEARYDVRQQIGYLY